MKDLKNILSLIFLLLKIDLFCSVWEVSIELPSKPKVSLEKGSKVVIAPFLVISEIEDEPSPYGKKAEEELRNYLEKMLSKGKNFEVIKSQKISLPSTNIEKLKNDSNFWIKLTQNYNGKFVISGVLNFEIKERSGYEVEEYVSPYDGRVYTRQRLVERTGVSLELLILVFDGKEGKLLYDESFKHFLEKKGTHYDFVTAFFEGVHSFEKKLEQIFFKRPVVQKRYFYAF